MSFSCPKCSFTTKYKGNLERHISKCQGETARPLVYVCKDCLYSTDNRCNLERHQQTDICKKRAGGQKSVEQRLTDLENCMLKINEWIESRPKTREEQAREEETIKDNIKERLTKFKVEFDEYDSLEGLRAKNRELTERLSILKRKQNESS